jgi:rSAM/selenodomain-associated transferase 1
VSDAHDLVQVIVIAKAPVPGRVKTRLTPPFTPEQAAALAEAALSDTLAAVSAAKVARRVLALEGAPGRWLPPGFDVIAQRGGGLDERIAAALDDAYATNPVPVVLIGMDTPQVTAGLIESAASALATGASPAEVPAAGTIAAGATAAADAVFGLATDGGFWLLGLRRPDPGLVLGVPMSRPDTGQAQLARLTQAGLRVHMMQELTDVDTAAEAEQIAAESPATRFAATLTALRGAGTVARP